MNASEVLKKCQDIGVEVASDGERLNIKSTKGKIPDQIKKLLTENKSEIVRYFESKEGKSLVGSKKSECERIPASHAQRRLWFLSRIDNANLAYVEKAAYRIGGLLDAKVLEDAFNKLVNRHVALRTIVDEVDGEIYQRSLQDVNLNIKSVNLDYDLESNGSEVREVISLLSDRTFDLSSDLMIRVWLLNFKDEQCVLYVNIHHLACDGWSLGILISELREIYTALNSCDGRYRLSSIDSSYREYSLEESKFHKSDVYKNKVSFWEETLKGVKSENSVILDEKRPVDPTFSGDLLKVDVPASLKQKVSNYSLESGVSPYVVMFSLFSYVVSRYSNNPETLIGTPVSGREFADSESLVGFFVNTIAVKAKLNEEDTFQTYLDRFKRYIVEASDNYDVPFDTVVEKINPDRCVGFNPLVQLVFSFQEFNRELGYIDGVKVEEYQIDYDYSKFDIYLNVASTGDDWSLYWNYSSEILSAETISRISSFYLKVLDVCVDHDDKRFLDLDLVPLSHFEEFYRVNSTEADLSSDLMVHQKFERYANSNPDSPAVIFKDRSYTYGELNENASKIASILVKSGCRSGDVVGIAMERSFEMVSSILAILKVGAAYSPIDVELPRKRALYQIEDCGMKRVLLHAPTESKFSFVGERGLSIDLESLGDDSDFSIHQEENCLIDAAYVIYTSGSTGNPKGVIVPHSALTNRIEWMQKRFPIDSTDTVIQKTPFSFDVSVWEFLWTLSNGARLVVAKPGGHKDPFYLEKIILDYGVSVLHFVPSMLDAYLESNTLPDSVRFVFCSGEELMMGCIEQYRQKNIKSELHNLYGPTEAAIDVSHFDCSSIRSSVPIGNPIDNIKLHILDDAQKATPIGVPGELYIEGVGLASGYINNEELTNEKFIKCDFDGAGVRRLYKTGDYARYNKNIEIEYREKRHSG